MWSRNRRVVMAIVDDEVARNPGPSAGIPRTLVQKSGENGQVQWPGRCRNFAGDDLKAWPIELGGARGNQHQGQGLTLAVRHRLTLAVRNELRRPAAEDQPETGNDSRLQPRECGQDPLEPRAEAAADAQVRPVNAQGKAECSGRRVQGIVRNQVGRHAPDALRSKAIQGDDEARPTQEAGGDQNAPVFQATGIARDPFAGAWHGPRPSRQSSGRPSAAAVKVERQASPRAGFPGFRRALAIWSLVIRHKACARTSAPRPTSCRVSDCVETEPIARFAVTSKASCQVQWPALPHREELAIGLDRAHPLHPLPLKQDEDDCLRFFR